MLLLSRAKGIVQFTKTDEFTPRFARISEGQLKNTGGSTSVTQKKWRIKQQENQKNVPPCLEIWSRAPEHLWGIQMSQRRLGEERQ